MFRKPKHSPEENDRVHSPVQALQGPVVAVPEASDSANEISSISSGITIVGKITGKGAVRISGRIKGELHASTVPISDSA